MSTVVAVVVFPGSNCEFDVAEIIESVGALPKLVSHQALDLSDADAVILPGGFAYGDYLRPGALARFSPVMRAVRDFAALGGPVLGICNGFQVLTEAGMLPGALQKNSGLRFLCEEVELEVSSVATRLTSSLEQGMTLRLPINHFEGNYLCSAETLASLRENDQIVLRYRSDVNGSIDRIAGICNEGRNVFGMMPHPEREGVHWEKEEASKRYAVIRSFVGR